MNHNCDYVYRMNRLLDPKSFNMYISLEVSYLGTKFYYEILLFCSSFRLSLYSRLNANQKIYKSKRKSLTINCPISPNQTKYQIRFIKRNHYRTLLKGFWMDSLDRVIRWSIRKITRFCTSN